MTAGEHTLKEIISQPEVWEEALAAFEAGQERLQSLFGSADYDQVIVTGCGSTYYLALTAARLLRHSGIDALAFPASELLLHGASICLPDRRYLLLSVSRSGSTSETVRAQQQFRTAGGDTVVTITCDSDSELALDADLVLAIDAAQEESVAQTRSFSSMALAAQQLAAGLAGHDLEASRRLPEMCRQLLNQHGELAKSLGEISALEKFFFLGSDSLYGIACEAMLKMKEMSLSYSEAYHTLEFRHGPMSIVGEDSLVIGLISPAAARQEVRVLDEMSELGAKVLAIGQTAADGHQCVKLPADLPRWCTPVLHLPALQLLAYHRAIHNGCDPDKPHQLSAVVSLEDV